jgi:hypothetical protein
MAKEDRQIKELINEGLSIISQMKIRSDSYAGANTNELKGIGHKYIRASPVASESYIVYERVLYKRMDA